jgi:SsrA-binding protein
MIAKNRKAYHNYNIIEKIEAGIVLEGWEAKSTRNNLINLDGAYVIIDNSVPKLIGAHINPMKDLSSSIDVNPTRQRTLLLHHREIKKLSEKINEKGLTLVPLSVYLKNNKVKIEVGIGRGKNNVDKKNTLKEKDMKREQDKASKSLRL